MNSQITSRESGVSEVFTPQRGAEYATLQQQIDEDALEIARLASDIQKAKDAIKGMQEKKREITGRRRRNVDRKRMVIKHHYEMLMVDEQ